MTISVYVKFYDGREFESELWDKVHTGYELEDFFEYDIGKAKEDSQAPLSH